MKISGDEKVNEIESFKYLEPVLQNDDSFKKEMKHMVHCGWIK